MRRFIAGLAAVAAVAVGVTALGTRAEAGPLPAFGGLGAARDAVAITENIQYFFGGRNYCWYDDGWQGPGSNEPVGKPSRPWYRTRLARLLYVFAGLGGVAAALGVWITTGRPLRPMRLALRGAS